MFILCTCGQAVPGFILGVGGTIILGCFFMVFLRSRTIHIAVNGTPKIVWLNIYDSNVKLLEIIHFDYWKNAYMLYWNVEHEGAI